jgi:hypothetical protein
MEALIERIRKYKGEEQNYKWPFNVKDIPLLNPTEKEAINLEHNEFKKTLALREIISRKINGSYTNYDLDSWIVNVWGKIGNFKIKNENSGNKDKIIDFKKHLDQGQLTNELFSTISSLSKIASFVEPNKYFIYDSRVTYSLNWLLLNTAEKDKIPQFFPFPNGRNESLKNYDMNVILHLKYKDEIKFYDKKYAYFEYCDLIKAMSAKVYEEKYPAYALEMLLFKIADTEILEEIKKLF